MNVGFLLAIAYFLLLPDDKAVGCQNSVREFCGIQSWLLQLCHAYGTGSTSGGDRFFNSGPALVLPRPELIFEASDMWIGSLQVIRPFYDGSDMRFFETLTAPTRWQKILPRYRNWCVDRTGHAGRRAPYG